MNRRDFLMLRGKGRRRVLELSCERLFMRYSDAQSAVGRRGGDTGPPTRSQQPWDGEPRTEIETPTVQDLLDELDRELSDARALRILNRHWLAHEGFRRAVEARVEAFRRRGGTVEFVDSPSQ